MITVLCVRYGNKYGKEYVERLRNMVSRHCTIPYEFVCLTDDPTPIDGVKLIVRPHAGYQKPWWHKVHMFDPSLGIKGRILYFDLDVAIVSNIEKLVAGLNEKDFFGIRDFNRKFHPNWQILNSSVMSWEAGFHTDIWTVFCDRKVEAMKLHGDQDWIYKIAKSRIKFWPDEYIMSYKWEIRQRNEIQRIDGKFQFKTVRSPEIPAHCSVLVFHGDPKPEDIKDPIIVDNWQ